MNESCRVETVRDGDLAVVRTEGYINREGGEEIERCIQARLNILVSGGTGTGKTTLLNVLSEAIPDSDRIVTIEDSAELSLDQRHTLRGGILDAICHSEVQA